MYVPGYTQDYTVHMVYEISCCLQESSELNKNYFNKYIIFL